MTQSVNTNNLLSLDSLATCTHFLRSHQSSQKNSPIQFIILHLENAFHNIIAQSITMQIEKNHLHCIILP